MKSYGKYSVLLSLYLAQSVPMSFFSTALPVIMRQEGFSLSSIALLQFVKLPWLLKLLWAPVVDSSAKNAAGYRRWILGSELFYALAVVSVSAFSLKTDFPTIVILIIAALLFSATQDVATDAMAARLLTPNERGPGNAVQSAGGFLGTVVGSGLLLGAYSLFGWGAVALGLAGFVLLAVLPVLAVKDSGLSERAAVKKARLSDIWTLFSGKGAAARLFVLASAWSGIIGIIAMLKPFLVDKGLTVGEIAVLNGVAGTSCAAASSLLGGQIVKCAGIKKSLASFMALNGVAALVMALAAGSGERWLYWAGSMAVWTAYGLSSVAVYVFAMNGVRGGREGTDFTSQIVVTQLFSLVISAASGKFADLLGYGALFGASCALSIVLTALFALAPLKLEARSAE